MGMDDEDKSLFRMAMRGVKPIKNNKILVKTPLPVAKKTPRKPADKRSTHFEFHDIETVPSVSSETLLLFKRSGIQDKILRKLKRGQYNVEAILDMHGLRVFEAREALADFLETCQNTGLKTVLIIHGKGHGGGGKPILKNKLNQWLRQTNEVLAFCSANPNQGSSGALYVLLKGRRSFE